MSNTVGEQKLWTEFKGGSYDAFSEIYHLFATDIIAYGFKIHHDEDLIRDVMHDLFVELWSTRERLANVGSVKFYLFKSFRYKLLATLKRNEKRIIKYEFNEELVDQDLLELINDKENKLNKLEDTLHQLAPRQREVIYLYFYLSYSITEISTLLSVNYQSVSNLLQRALIRLRSLLHILLSLSGFFISRLHI
ncbi:sigma-70 family RNA polymerase sigma factor [Sphingobacterium ginsenosidimutans]|uniref:Sigma-70 family RNA polymerase sigma factor n=1 Tax=Sphingobacterium ginsenosidimutans TaxID=687845 RepID=A0ABP8A518_9SPHI